MFRFFLYCSTILLFGIHLGFGQIIPGVYLQNNLTNSLPAQQNTPGPINTKKRDIAKSENPISLKDTLVGNKPKLNPFSSTKTDNPKTDTLEKLIFGKSFFSNKNLLFQPNLKIATPQNYIVGPDDELIIDIYGYSEEHYDLIVTSDGYVKIPKVGLVQVGGLTIQEVKRKLISKLSKIFIGLKSEGSGLSTTNLYASVTLGNIRQINVLVQGEVENPGSFNVPSLSKAINLLYLAGGPTTNGTFRNIEIIRNNKLLGKIDLYDYLIGGILKNDFTLQDRDIIKVGLYENRVTVQGKVKRPLIFEFLPNESLEKVLENFAGGFAEDAYRQSVKLTRYTSKERKILDVNFDLASSFNLKTGDLIAVESINTERFENRIKILGEVWRPGDYSLDNCPTISKLIEKAGGLKENAFTDRILIKRLKSDNTFENISINLKDNKFNQLNDISLKREDEIFVQAKDRLREDYTVTIHGEINFQLEKNSTTALTTSSTDNEKSNVQMDDVESPNITQEEEISEKLKSKEANNKLLNRQTKLTIPFVANMTVEDLILKAGGLRESANAGYVEVVRRNKSIQDLENQSEITKIGQLFKFQINKDLTIDENASKFKLEPFDEVFIRSSSSYQIQQFITLKGEIKYPGVYGLETKNEKISSILARAGNLTNTANIDGASLLRKRKKSEIDDELRKDQIKGLENNYNGIIVQDTESNSSNFEKIGINLQKIITNPGGNEDLIIEDGDILDIPILKQTVKISGEVIHPTTITFKDDFSLRDYINHSGGFTQKSARNKGYVIYANGSIDRTRHFLFFKSYPKILPGSEIVIPSYNRNTQQVASFINIYTGTITSLVSVYLLLRATTK